MNTISVKSAYASFSSLMAHPMVSSMFAQVVVQSQSDVKNLVGRMAGVVILISWLLALVAYIAGVIQKHSNPAAGKEAFMVAIGLVLGGPLIGVLFYIIYGSSGTPTASFT